MMVRRFPARAAGALIMLLGAWGGIVPFVGPLFGYRMDGLGAWAWSTPRAELSLGPGVIALVGGLLLLVGLRGAQRFGGLLAFIAGAWFAVGPSFFPLWTGAVITVPSGTVGGLSPAAMRAVEQVGYFYGTGVLIASLAAFAIGVLTLSAVRVVTREPAAMELAGTRGGAPVPPTTPAARQMGGPPGEPVPFAPVESPSSMGR